MKYFILCSIGWIVLGSLTVVIISLSSVGGSGKSAVVSPVDAEAQGKAAELAARHAVISRQIDSCGAMVEDYFRDAARMEESITGALFRSRALHDDLVADFNRLESATSSFEDPFWTRCLMEDLQKHKDAIAVAMLMREALAQDEQAYFSSAKADFADAGGVRDGGASYAAIQRAEFAADITEKEVALDPLGGEARSAKRIYCMENLPVVIRAARIRREIAERTMRVMKEELAGER